MKSKKIILLNLSLFFPLVLNCWTAPIVPDLRFSNVRYAPGQSRTLAAKSEKIKDLSGVEVFDSSLPVGFKLSGGKLIPDAEYVDSYKILGTVSAEYDTGVGTLFMNVFWAFGDYKETWRKSLCYPQAPLKCLTLGIWNVFPFSWPCLKSEPGTEEGRKEDLVRHLVRGAKAMGGNMIILGRSKDQNYTVISGTGQTYGNTTTVFGSASSGSYRYLGLRATVIRKNNNIAPLK